jgi:hypothetical protein
MATDNTGIVVISGKEYLTVARRLKDFWSEREEWSIHTKVTESAQLVRVKAVIKDSEGRTRSTGHAEEDRENGNINRTSAIENCETGAVGRALGVLGYTGSAIASAEEMEAALEQQKELPIIDHNAKVREHLGSIVALKTYLANEEYGLAYEAWHEIPADDKGLLWRATSKGGILETLERKQMQSNGWTEARQQFHDIGEDNE